MSRVSCRRVPHSWCLSGMGLTRERGGCAGRWLSRLDVNACHRRIYKPAYYYCTLVAHILGTKDTRHDSGSHRTEQKGENQADEHWPPKYGTGLPNLSHETKLSGTNADREMSIFPVQLTTCRVGNPTRLIHTFAKCVIIHHTRWFE